MFLFSFALFWLGFPFQRRQTVYSEPNMETTSDRKLELLEIGLVGGSWKELLHAVGSTRPPGRRSIEGGRTEPVKGLWFGGGLPFHSLTFWQLDLFA